MRRRRCRGGEAGEPAADRYGVGCPHLHAPDARSRNNLSLLPCLDVAGKFERTHEMRMLFKSVLASVVLTALGGCAAVTPGAVPANGTNVPASIAISVGPCFGFCPVYDAKIVADGIVSFTGTRHTTVLGTRERRAAPDTYHKLEADLASFRPAAAPRRKFRAAPKYPTCRLIRSPGPASTGKRRSRPTAAVAARARAMTSIRCCGVCPSDWASKLG